MNQIAAFQDTLTLARQHNMDVMSSDNPELDYPHLADMFNRATVGLELAPDHPDFMSDTKLGRWLGWAQAAVVSMCDGVTLEDMKAINKKWAD